MRDNRPPVHSSRDQGSRVGGTAGSCSGNAEQCALDGYQDILMIANIVFSIDIRNKKVRRTKCSTMANRLGSRYLNVKHMAATF